MTPILLDFARKSGFTLCKEESALREMLEQFAKFIIEHEALKQPDHEPAFWYYTLVVEGQVVNEAFTTANWDTRFEPFGRRGVDHGGEVTKEPLYTTPQPQREWIGLTDQEVKALVSWWPSYDQMPAIKVLIKDVTNSLKEKNT